MIKEIQFIGNCLGGMGIPDRGSMIIDTEETPNIFDLVHCDSPTGTITGYIKQIVQTGKHPIVRTRYVNKDEDYLFYSPSIYGVVLKVLDSERKVVWERPESVMTNGGRFDGESIRDDSINLLYGLLKKAKISWNHAEAKPGVDFQELKNLRRKVECIDWILEFVKGSGNCETD